MKFKRNNTLRLHEMRKLQLPDQISISRALIAVASMTVFQASENFGVRYFAITSWTLSLIADSLDGYIARRLHVQSENGARVDILSDRITETCAWVTIIASLDYAFLIIAILIIAIRNLLTDYAKVVIMAQNRESIGGVPEMKNFQDVIVNNPRSKASYNILKAVAIISLLLTVTMHLEPNSVQVIFLGLLICYSLLRASGSVVHCKFPVRINHKQIPWSIRSLLCVDILFLIAIVYLLFIRL